MPERRATTATLPSPTARGRREVRITAHPVELRENDDGTLTMRGYAAVFNSPSEGLPFVEVILPGAFSRTLAAQPDVRLLYNHDADSVMARTSAGTLVLTEDAHGLAFEATVDPDDFDVQRVAPKMRAGSVNQCSFAFWITDADAVQWRRLPDGRQQREISAVDLDDGDVSIVTYPAYPDTEAELRALADTVTETPATTRAVAARALSAGNERPVRGIAATIELLETNTELVDLAARLHRTLRGLGTWTVDDAWKLLDDAIGAATSIPYWYYWISAIGDGWLIFVDDSARPWQMYRVTFDVADDGTVTLGEPELVIAKHEYLPAPTSDDDVTDTPEDDVDDAEERSTGDTPAKVPSVREIRLRRDAERLREGAR